MLTAAEIIEIKKLGELLGHQGCIRVPKEIYHYAKAQQSLFCLVCDLYNYGYIMGQRAERARRKGGAQHD